MVLNSVFVYTVHNTIPEKLDAVHIQSTMTRKSATPPARTTYRHGDLRRALLDAGVQLARDGGPAAVVLREATRRAGVVPNAAYRHFASREELLQAVRAAALSALAVAMERELAALAAWEAPRQLRAPEPAGDRNRLPAIRADRNGVVSHGIRRTQSCARRDFSTRSGSQWPESLSAVGRRARQARRGGSPAARAPSRRGIPGVVRGARPRRADHRRTAAPALPCADRRHHATPPRHDRKGTVADVLAFGCNRTSIAQVTHRAQLLKQFCGNSYRRLLLGGVVS